MSTAIQAVSPPSGLDRQLDAIQRVLQQSTPKEAIQWRPGKGGRQMAYASHVFVTQTLNDAFGWRWSFEIDNEQILHVGEIPFEATCRGRLTVWLPGVKHPITKMQMGCQPIEMLKDSIKPVSLGDALKGAGSDALKKCASLLGIALDLYDPANDARKNPTGEQLKAASEPAETDPNKIAFNAQKPLESQLTPKTRADLGAVMTALRDELRVSVEDMQEEMRTSTGKTSRDDLTEEQGRGMLGIYELLAKQLRSTKAASIVPDDDQIPF